MPKKPTVAALRISPMSVNKCWQGRRFKTKEYKAWRDLAGLLLSSHKKHKGEVNLSVKFYIKNYKMADTDNLIKSFQDALVDVGVVEDDRKIIKITAEKFKSEEEFIEYEIAEAH